MGQNASSKIHFNHASDSAFGQTVRHAKFLSPAGVFYPSCDCPISAISSPCRHALVSRDRPTRPPEVRRFRRLTRLMARGTAPTGGGSSCRRRRPATKLATPGRASRPNSPPTPNSNRGAARTPPGHWGISATGFRRGHKSCVRLEAGENGTKWHVSVIYVYLPGKHGSFIFKLRRLKQYSL